MKLLVLVPKVVRNFIAQFPEVRRNAYKYFNYDNRVVDERVERFDNKVPYLDADDFKNADYEDLVTYAKTLVNPILSKYSSRVAAEDALSVAIRSYRNGLFDGKVNAGRFEVLLQGMGIPKKTAAKNRIPEKKSPEKKEKPVVIKPHIVKQLGIDPRKVIREQQRTQKKQKGLPIIVKEKGKIVKK